MTVEERTQDAIRFTRVLLPNIMNDPRSLTMMTYHEVDPQQIEDQVYLYLEYMDLTKPDKAKEALDLMRKTWKENLPKAEKTPSDRGREAPHTILGGAAIIPPDAEGFSLIDAIEDTETLRQRVNRLEGTIESLDAEIQLVEKELNLGDREDGEK